MRLINLSFVACAALSVSSLVVADPMLQPSAASSNMGNFSTYDPIHAIDQTGLASTYTSGVTNFDTFVTATSTSGGGNGGRAFFSTVTTGNFDFDLGGSFNIQSLALWTDPQHINQSLKNFDVIAANNPAFTSPIALGSFTSLDGVTEPNNFGQVFTFSPTTASYVRLQITSNYGSTITTGISEAAFEVVSIPEPATMGVMGLIAMIFLQRRGR